MAINGYEQAGQQLNGVQIASMAVACPVILVGIFVPEVAGGFAAIVLILWVVFRFIQDFIDGWNRGSW